MKVTYCAPTVTRLGKVEDHTATIVDSSKDLLGHGRI